MVVMSTCDNFNPKRLDGWKDLYLFNCSGDDITIEISLANIEKQMQMHGIFRSNSSESFDTVPAIKRIEYYEWLFENGSYIESEDSLLIILKPEEGMRIVHLEWLIAPTKFRESDLNIDDLRIITKSDTIIARSRKEILELQFDKKCKDGIYYKTIKYGRHGAPIMREKVWRGR
jgi:hypothetical protein